MGLSPLRYHKKRHNFSDTPSEICLCGNGEEDTAHFLLLCPFFVNQRTYLTALVEEIIGRTNLVVLNHVDLYLYGHPLNVADNQKNCSFCFLNLTLPSPIPIPQLFVLNILLSWCMCVLY